MAILPIFKYPSPVLRKKSAPVTEFGPELEELVKDMAETMYDAPGVGLAAPQIGVSKQLIIYDTAAEDEKGDYTALVNPKILEAAGEEIGEEGCLSVRDYAAEVKRAQWIKLQAQDIEGNDISFEAEDWLARVLQHEIDHLNGILFIDHLSSLKRMLYKKKLKKFLQMNKEKEAAR
ncbi:MAG: peptide deformylase [Thermodesulfobacteriota bacterium]